MGDELLGRQSAPDEAKALYGMVGEENTVEETTRSDRRSTEDRASPPCIRQGPPGSSTRDREKSKV